MKRANKALLIFLIPFFYLAIHVYSQTPVADSLRTKLLTAANDSNKVILELALSNELTQSGNQSRAITFAEEAKSIAGTVHYKRGEGKACLTLGNIYLSESHFEKALESYGQSLKIFKELEFQKGIAIALNNIGNLYYYKSDFQKALTYYDSSLTVRINNQDELGIAMSYNNIGAIYKNYGSYVKGLDYYLKSLIIREKVKDKTGMATSYNNIGEIYRLLNDFPKATKYNYLSLKINTEIGDKPAIATSLNNLGILFAMQGDYRNAYDFFRKCAGIRQEVLDSRGLAQVYNNIGNLFTDLYNKPDSVRENFTLHFSKSRYRSTLNRNSLLDSAFSLHHDAESRSNAIDDKEQQIYALMGMGSVTRMRLDYKDAIPYYQQVIQLADKFHFLKELGDANYALYECYQGLNKYKEALDWFVKYKATQDSLSNIENKASGIKFDLNYISEKKEAVAKAESAARERIEKVIEKRQQIAITALGTLLLIVIIFSFFFYRSYRLKKKDNLKILEQRMTIESALKEKEALITEIHHRVKNNLQVISSMLNLQIDKTISKETKDALIGAQERIRSMALIHGLLYSRNQFQEIDMSLYLPKLVLEIAKGYSSPDKKIETIFYCDKLIFSLEKAIPVGLLVNEIVTNSFKHAFKNTDKGTVSLRLEQRDELCYLEVSDDGSGMSEASGKKIEKSLGTELIHILSEQINGKLVVKSDKGLSYSIYFP